MATDVERLVVRMEASLTAFEKQMKRASDVADGSAAKIERRFNSMNRNLEGIGTKFLKGFVTGALSTAFSTQSLTAITDTVHSLAALGDTADRIGVTAEELQKLRYAADLAGGSADDLDAGFLKFSKNVSDAGRNTGDLYKVFQLNGIALRDQAGNLRSSTDLFKDYADLVVRTKNPQDQLNLAVIGLGKAAGPQLLGLLRQGGAGIDDLASRAERAGAVIGNDVVAQAGRLDDQLVLLKGQLSTAFAGFAVEVAPTVVSAIEAITGSLKDLSFLLAQIKKGDISGLADMLMDPSAVNKAKLTIRSGSANKTLTNGQANDFYNDVFGTQKVLNPGGAGGPPAVLPQGVVSKDELQRQIDSVTKQTDALLAQTTAQAALNPLVNDYGFAVDKARITQELLTAAQEAGIKITPDLAAKIDGLATRYANASVASEQLAESQEKIKERADAFNSLGKEVVGGFIDDLKNGKTAAEAFEGALDKILNKLLDMSLDSLFSSGKGGGLGGIIAGLFKGFAKGGVVRAATGGAIAGRGTGTSDSIPAMLSNGEYVVSAKQTAKHRALLDAINGGGIRGFAAGGLINPGRAIGSGAAGAGLNLQIITPPGVAVGSQESRPNSRGGRDMIVKLVQQTTLDTLSNGSADAPLAGRFGARPRKIV
jgi:hypothetical protein